MSEYIKKEDAINLTWREPTYTDPLNVLTEVRDGLNELPTYSFPDREKGEWIVTIEDWNKWTCSKCGWNKRTDIHVNLGYNFCPKCGADMRGGKE